MTGRGCVERRHGRRSGDCRIGAGCRIDGDAVGHQQGRQCRAQDVVRGTTANREVLRVNQPVAGQPLRCGGGDPGVARYRDPCRRGFDEATVTAVGRARVQGATHVHGACFHTTHQHDGALDILQRLGLNDTRVVDRVGQQAARCLRGQQHLAAVGPEHSAVFHQRIDRALINRHIKQLVARDIQCHGAACGQGNRAQLRRNNALVAHVGAQQGHIAPAGGIDASLVDDAAGAVAGELVAARHQIGVRDVQCRCHQTAHIDRCTLTEQDAVGIHQKHLAVGVQAAQDAGRIGANDTVERDRTAAGLHKLHRLARLDAKALPVDRHVGRGLGDCHVARSAADAGAAG